MEEKNVTKLEDEVLKSRRKAVAITEKMHQEEKEEEQEEMEYYIDLIKKVFIVSDNISLIKQKDYTIWTINMYINNRIIYCVVDIGERQGCTLENWPFKLSETKEIRRAIMNLEGAVHYASIHRLTNISSYFDKIEGFSGKRDEGSVLTVSIDKTIFENEEASE